MVNQYPIIYSELACFLNMDSSSFDVDLFEGIVDLVVHSCHSLEPFFCGRGEEFEVA